MDNVQKHNNCTEKGRLGNYNKYYGLLSRRNCLINLCNFDVLWIHLLYHRYHRYFGIKAIIRLYSVLQNFYAQSNGPWALFHRCH
jgi:hypothetical protein